MRNVRRESTFAIYSGGAAEAVIMVKPVGKGLAYRTLQPDSCLFCLQICLLLVALSIRLMMQRT